MFTFHQLYHTFLDTQSNPNEICARLQISREALDFLMHNMLTRVEDFVYQYRVEYCNHINIPIPEIPQELLNQLEPTRTRADSIDYTTIFLNENFTLETTSMNATASTYTQENVTRSHTYSFYQPIQPRLPVIQPQPPQMAQSSIPAEDVIQREARMMMQMTHVDIERHIEAGGWIPNSQRAEADGLWNDPANWQNGRPSMNGSLLIDHTRNPNPINTRNLRINIPQEDEIAAGRHRFFFNPTDLTRNTSIGTTITESTNMTSATAATEEIPMPR